MSDEQVKIPVQCPDCGREYRVPERHLGRTVRCRCGSEITLDDPKVEVTCSHCRRVYRIRQRHLGNTVACRCGEAMELAPGIVADRILVHRLEPWPFLRIGMIIAASAGVATSLVMVCAVFLGIGVHVDFPVPFGRLHLAMRLAGSLVSSVGQTVLGVIILLVLFNWVMGRLGGLPVRLGSPVRLPGGRGTCSRIDVASAALVAGIVGGLGALLFAPLLWCIADVLPSMSLDPLVLLMLQLIGIPLYAAAVAAAYNYLARNGRGVVFEATAAPGPAATTSSPARGPVGVRGIGVWAWALVGLARGVVGGLMVLIPALFLAFLVGVALDRPGLVAYALLLPLAVPVLGLLGSALQALLYNLAGYLMGGVKVGME